MKLVYGHCWALWLWRHTYGQAIADNLRACINLDPAPRTVSELDGAGAFEAWREGISRGYPHDLPMSLMFLTSNFRARSENVHVRVWPRFVPYEAICRAEKNFVSSPEFTYVQIAGDIKRICKERLERWQYVVVLAELGCELCGTYSKQNIARGFKNREFQLVSACQMKKFASSVAHERGARLANDSLFWVIDGLNSPMETVVYLMLCLPSAWGGLELAQPRGNWALDVADWLAAGAPQQTVIPDLYWPEWQLAVEYFGEDSHDGRERKDYERRELEQQMGLNVVTFWKNDVTDLRRFNKKAAQVAGYLGMKLPEFTDKFAGRQRKLQHMLVRHQRWV